MSSSRSSAPALLAPSSPSSSVGAWAPGRHDRRPSDLPAVDERLVAPESHAEIVGGVVYQTMGANPPHATQHADIARLFSDCLAPGYVAAVDMLTRSTKKTDAAPDVSVFPAAPDPDTGGRQLEEVAVEVVDTESLDHVTKKARRLAKRGVRRLFYLRVADRTVHEWQHESGEWAPLDAGTEIRDRCFVVPIPVRALAERVLADDTVARALIATGNPVIVAALKAAQDEAARLGRSEGLRDGALAGALTTARASLLRVLTKRGLALTDAQRERVQACTEVTTLEGWLDRAIDAKTSDDVFA